MVIDEECRLFGVLLDSPDDPELGPADWPRFIA
jgi:hypothetical protein